MSAEFAPEEIIGITVEFTPTDATYPSDEDPFTVALTAAELTSGPFKYKKTAANVGQLNFTDWSEGKETYTGSFELTFTSADGGTFYKTYSGSYTGFISGDFKITLMDDPRKPVAKSKTVSTKKGKKVQFRLQGEGFDIREAGLDYKIVKEPKTGKLNVKKLPLVVYQPKPGFTGTVKFTYIVKEGKTASKPATVKLVVK